MLGIKITIVRYISDDPQPGIVEFELEDAHGRRWSFVDKTAISTERLDSKTTYPRPGVIACEMVESDIRPGEQRIVRISTERPWGVESVDGTTEFEVLSESLVEM